MNGEVFFVPFYDINSGTDISPADILGKDHIIIAKATIDGETIESEKVILSVSTATYKIVLDSVITEAFTLDTIKNNSQKITFSIQADYDENGVFGQIASWDIGVYELLSINSGELPGRFVTEYDESKKIIGKSFVPIYDENNNGGIVFTKVAGRVHSIRASIEQYNIFEETTVEVKAPIYDISLRKDRIRVLDVSIRKNTEGVEFIVSRDGRILNYEELDALSPFNIELSRNKDSIKMECSVKTDESGNSYIFCRPDYSGKFYIPISVFNWICMLSIEDGETIATYTLGKNSASATIDIETSELAVIVCIICLAVLLLVLWMLFCYLTRKRIVKGLFFIANYKRIEGHPSKYKFEGAYQVKSYGLRHFFHGSLLIPFSEPKIFVGGKICTTTAFRKGTPEIRFERGSNGEYVPHISGVFVAEEDWNHLVTNQINVLDEVGFNQFTESSAKFVFGTQNYIVKDNGGNVLSLITFASNDTIKAIRRMLEMIEQNNK
ncbi:MAG: hypothetical protein J6V36_00015 [Clostridia bacterium]|nr:hypothetical protein [Clostridia bacterium]